MGQPPTARTPTTTRRDQVLVERDGLSGGAARATTQHVGRVTPEYPARHDPRGVSRDGLESGPDIGPEPCDAKPFGGLSQNVDLAETGMIG